MSHSGLSPNSESSALSWDYIAGFFDGEGSVALDRKTKAVFLYFSNTNRAILEAIQKVIGVGSLIEVQTRVGDSRWGIKSRLPIYRLTVRRRGEAMKVMLELVQRCRVKQEKLKQVIALRQAIPYVASPDPQRKPVTKELLLQLYCEQQLTSNEVGKLLGYSGGQIRHLIKRLGIPGHPRGGGTERAKERIGKAVRAAYLEKRMRKPLSAGQLPLRGYAVVSRLDP